MNFLIFFITFFSLKAFATTAILSTQFAGQSKQWSAGLQHSVDRLPEDISMGVSVDFARTTQTSNYNLAMNDLTIEKNALSIGADLGWAQTLGFYLEATSAGINSREATEFGLKTRLSFMISDFTMTAGLSDQYLRQISDFKISGSSVQDQLTLKNQKQSIAVRYSGYEDVIFSVTFDKYSYDRDIQSLNTLLSVKNVLNQNGAAFLSQINSLLDHEVSIDLSYTLNEDIDLDFTASESADYLDPHTKSRGYRLGTTYYISDFDLSAGVSNVRALDSGESSFSVDATVAYSF